MSVQNPFAFRPAAFRKPYAVDDTALAEHWLAAAQLGSEDERRIDTLGHDLITAIRETGHGVGGVEDLLRAYALSTPEGLALMVLAEALLRVPDHLTAEKLIEDKLGQGDFLHHEIHSDTLMVTASAWALGLSARVIRPGETPDTLIGQLGKRIGLPTLRIAVRQAMRLLGQHFVLGQSIEEALHRAASPEGQLFRYSYDMLGEGARTAADARHYREAYHRAITVIGRGAGDRPLPDRPGISVKLSALHPRYEATAHAQVMAELCPVLLDLAREAKAYDLNFTVDAEEADRLELSLDVIGAVFADPSLAGWDGFGLAIQAYQKRAMDVIDWCDDLAKGLGRRMMVRLVKGAYWDSEIKRAQERGLADYPVFTRKAMTDLSYQACARRLLAARPRLYPQFATHNALTVATLLIEANGTQGFEFQRLHGMGDTLYRHLLAQYPDLACRTYAPVGGHRELLAYLVRRLLENGANSSFVSVAADPQVPIETLLQRPAALLGSAVEARHRHLPLPQALYGNARQNSCGVEFGHAESLQALQAEVAQGAKQAPLKAASLIDGHAQKGNKRFVAAPQQRGHVVGEVLEAESALADVAMRAAHAGYRVWQSVAVQQRAAALRQAANRLEQQRGLFLHLLQQEAGKTLDDALAEVREAVDFCRYYAVEAERLMGHSETLPGPTGETNLLRLRPRGVFVAVSPWNFPLAIFMGQIAAALVTGNSVVAKPAEQTPLIAYAAVQLLHLSGIAPQALQLVLGDGRIGAALTAHPLVAGVVFTGSTQTAKIINRTLAARDGAIVPLIAETGGINVMLVDGTALNEQVCDDVVLSAFRSAGQRCSALRVVCVQEDVADGVIKMIQGAAQTLRIGDPAEITTHIGPVIDQEAQDKLTAQIAALAQRGTCLWSGHAPQTGTFIAPHLFEIKDLDQAHEELFGPDLQIYRYKAHAFDHVLAQIDAMGYGLTLGVHSRIDSVVETITGRLSIGNCYINRNMIGAVVGTQPFGGTGLSGTGPKAGGPHYLLRFVTEQTVTTNTAAAGGNADLLLVAD